MQTSSSNEAELMHRWARYDLRKRVEKRPRGHEPYKGMGSNETTANRYRQPKVGKIKFKIA